MPEPSDNDRRKASQLDPAFANYRLVDALERGWEIGFRCQYCGATKTWRRDIMLGRAKAYLGRTMAQIQAHAVCPRCPGRMPIMSMSGVVHPTDMDRRHWELINALLDAGIDPTSLGYGHGGKRPGH
jgi:hypothetical protein